MLLTTAGNNLWLQLTGERRNGPLKIHATELWGLLMETQSLDPGCAIKVDCQGAQRGAQRDSSWAMAPCRTLARVWGPVAEALSCELEQVVWMLAHNSESGVGSKSLSNGEALTISDVIGNDLVDELAKQAARADALPEGQILGAAMCRTLMRRCRVGWQSHRLSQ